MLNLYYFVVHSNNNQKHHSQFDKNNQNLAQIYNKQFSQQIIKYCQYQRYIFINNTYYCFQIQFGIICQIIRTLHKMHTNKYQFIHQSFWLTTTLHPQFIQFTVLHTPPMKLIKYSHKITSTQISQNLQQLKQFGNMQQLFNFIKNGKQPQFHFQSQLSSSSFFSNQSKTRCQKEQKNNSFCIVLNWKIISGGYSKNIVCKIKMNQDKLNQFQELKYQNMLLKKKIQIYEAKQIQSKNINQGIKNQQYNQIVAYAQPQQSKDQKITQIINNQIKPPLVVPLSQNEHEFEKQSESVQIIQKYKGKQRNILKNQIKDKKDNKQKQQVFQKHKVSVQKDQTKKRGRRKKISNVIPQTEQKIVPSQKKSTDMMKVTFANGDYYYGQIKNNLYHGHGIYSSKTSGTFQGQWLNGKANGYGISKDISGNQHSGFYINDKRTGNGLDIYTNGERYCGNFEQDQKSGFGKYTYLNGDCYEGQWKSDLYHGKGKQTYNDGSSYQGYWFNDEKEGQGIFTSPLGIKAKQVWQKGVQISEKQL